MCLDRLFITVILLIVATNRKQQAGFKMSKHIRYAYMMEYSADIEVIGIVLTGLWDTDFEMEV